MNISSTSPKIAQRPLPVAPKTEDQSAQSITERIVEATVDKTLAGTDRFAGAVSGFATGSAAYLSKMPGLAADGVKSALNLFQAEKIGPNIKVVSVLASRLIAGLAVAGAGLGLVVAAGAGVVNGFTTHNAEKPREFTIDQAVSKVWNQTRSSVEEIGQSAIQSSQEVKEIEVKPGDELWDIPLPPFARTGKTVAATVAGLALGGVGGLATAVATTFQEAWNGLKEIPKDFSLQKLAAGVGSLVAAPFTGVIHGLSKVVSTPIAAAGTAWRADSLKEALKSGAAECYDTKPGIVASSVGTFVGGTSVALAEGAVTAIGTTAKEIGRSLRTAVSDPNLNIASGSLSAAGGLLGAPVAGVAHGALTALGGPVSAVLSGWKDGFGGDTIAKGFELSSSGTSQASAAVGAVVGNAPGAVLSGVTASGAAFAREIADGLSSAAGNEKLYFSGKVLDGVGGVPGDVVSAAIQGVGTTFVSIAGAAVEGFNSGHSSDGVKRGAQQAVKGVAMSINPKVAVESVPAERV